MLAVVDQWFWFFLLLPLAAASGWLIGRRGGERHSDTQVSRLSTTYFRGLNYLLNEQILLGKLLLAIAIFLFAGLAWRFLFGGSAHAKVPTAVDSSGNSASLRTAG